MVNSPSRLVVSHCRLISGAESGDLASQLFDLPGTRRENVSFNRSIHPVTHTGAGVGPGEAMLTDSHTSLLGFMSTP